MEGKIKWYNYQKGYGFVAGDDGEEYFVHKSQVDEKWNLKEDTKISFTPVETDKGKQATGINVVGEDNV